jgi:hypothetical protein
MALPQDSAVEEGIMGTNYYAVYNGHNDIAPPQAWVDDQGLLERLDPKVLGGWKGPDNCPEPRFLHIGKSSIGWCFSLHVYPLGGPKNLSDWMAEWCDRGVHIVDEYGERVTASQMLRIISDRSHGHSKDHPEDGDSYDHPGYPQGMTYGDYLRRNHAVRGPNGLLRHKASDLPGREVKHPSNLGFTYDHIQGPEQRW